MKTTNNLTLKEIYRQRREWVSRYKAAVGCAICHETRPQALDIHHRNRYEKRFTISEAIHSKSIEQLQEEIQERGIVLCATCHRLVEAGVLTLAEPESTGQPVEAVASSENG